MTRATFARGPVTTGLLLVAISLLHAQRADAKFLFETPADIVRLRGMPVALAVCLITLLLVRQRLATDAQPTGALSGDAPRRELRPSVRLRRWFVVGAFTVFLFATIPIGFPIASAIVRRIGHDGWRNSINAAAAVLGVAISYVVFQQPHRRRVPVALSVAAIGAAYLYFFAVLDVPVKRIHFMEYSVLSVLVHRALRDDAPARIHLWCAAAAMLVGMSEEALSLLSAQRFGAVSDVLWDTTGGSLGVLALKYVFVQRPALSTDWTRRTTEAVC